MSLNNSVRLIGRVGRDPETRTTQSGDMVVSFSMATTDRWKDKDSGERKEATEWHRIVIWNPAIAKVAEQYVKKGDMIGIEGAIKTRKFTDKDGVERTSTEIVIDRFKGELMMLGSPGGDGAEKPTPREAQPAARTGRADPRTRAPATGPQWGSGSDDLSDDIPF